jgi:RES domain
MWFDTWMVCVEKSDWEIVIQDATLETLSGDLWRVVESQSEIATIDIVDTLEEQHRLEELLDSSKPPYPQNSTKDYLLSTPFRYPPLKWGSRFGTISEMSIFYGSCEPHTALAELAFYRFVFLEAVEVPFPNPIITTSHDIFSATYKFEHGLDLTTEPFEGYSEHLRSKVNYSATQSLGALLREMGIGGIRYNSVRCPKGGINIAILEEKGLVSEKPEKNYGCFCELSPEKVTFKIRGNRELLEFPRDMFLINGLLPSPA